MSEIARSRQLTESVDVMYVIVTLWLRVVYLLTRAYKSNKPREAIVQLACTIYDS